MLTTYGFLLLLFLFRFGSSRLSQLDTDFTIIELSFIEILDSFFSFSQSCITNKAIALWSIMFDNESLYTVKKESRKLVLYNTSTSLSMLLTRYQLFRNEIQVIHPCLRNSSYQRKPFFLNISTLCFHIYMLFYLVNFLFSGLRSGSSGSSFIFSSRSRHVYL